MLFKEFSEAWRKRERDTPLEPEPTFREAGLVLGADTILAPAGEDGDAFVRVDGSETRLLVLLSAAYGRVVGGEALGHIRRAATQRRDGNAALASMHLALAKLGRMPRPRDAARRLYMADRLLEAGAAPETIVRALDLGADAARLLRLFNPEQPRVPAGSGVESGRWTSGEGLGVDGSGDEGSAAAETTPEAAGGDDRTAPTPEAAGRDDHAAPAPQAPAAQDAAVDALARAPTPEEFQAARDVVEALKALGSDVELGGLSVEALVGLAEIAAFAPAAITFAGVLLIPTNDTSGKVAPIPGRPGYFYQKLLGEYGWHIVYVDRDGKRSEIPPGPDGIWRDAQAQPLARLLPKGALALDTRTPAESKPKKPEPQTCPAPVPDKFGQGPGSRSKAYEDQMKRLVNPEAPTPSGMGRALANPPSQTGIVVFDDCWLLNGNMFEYKGPEYAKLIDISKGYDAPWKFRGQWLKQSVRQIQAASLSGRRVIWIFAEPKAALYAFGLFNWSDEGREHITVAVFPYQGD